MASGGAPGVSEQVVHFDIYDESIFSGNNVLTENLTQDEREEIYRVVGEIEGANSREIIDFTSQEFTLKTHQT